MNTLVLTLIVLLSCALSVFGTLKFLLIADWGGLPFFPYVTFVEMGVAREMAMITKKQDMDFILALGDNFYLKGVESVDDPRFQETFEIAFNYSSLNIPWYLVAGNHDHYGNVSAQILYSTKSARWNFLDYYYKMTYQIPSSNATVDFLMLDTVILCGNTDMSRYAQPEMDLSMKHYSENHWKWLEDNLAHSKADYKIVCGHYPVYSIGHHGSTDCLVDRLEPLLVKYRVDAYLSGHDHNIQHIQVKNNSLTLDYFVSGSANFVDPSLKHKSKLPPDSLRFHWANPFSLGAFAFLELSSENFTFNVLSSGGKELYSYSKRWQL